MSQENVEIVRRSFEAVNRSDAETMPKRWQLRDTARAMSQEDVERLREGVCEVLRELVLAPALRAPS